MLDQNDLFDAPVIVNCASCDGLIGLHLIAQSNTQLGDTNGLRQSCVSCCPITVDVVPVHVRVIVAIGGVPWIEEVQLLTLWVVGACDLIRPQPSGIPSASESDNHGW